MSKSAAAVAAVAATRVVPVAGAVAKGGVKRGLSKSRAPAHQVKVLAPSDVGGRKAALAIAIKQVEGSHGKGSIMKLGSKKAVTGADVIPTGSLALDHALGTGGLPRGRVVEVYGMESCGKTTVALHVIAECQRLGGTAVFIDAEHALDPAYAKSVGVSVKDMYISQPDSGEQALDIVETLVRSGSVDCIVIDSVAALVPRAELDGEMGDHHIALQARLMSQAMRKLTSVLAKTKCLCIFINQIRQKVGVVFGNPDVTTGGNALRFYSSVRLEVRKGQQIKKDGNPIGNECRIKVAKNKLAPPFQWGEVDMLYGSGFDRVGELIDLGVQTGLVKKSGAWFSLSDGLDVTGTELSGKGAAQVSKDGVTLVGQGKSKSRDFILEHPKLRERLETTIKARLQTAAEVDDEDLVGGIQAEPDLPPTEEEGTATA